MLRVIWQPNAPEASVVMSDPIPKPHTRCEPTEFHSRTWRVVRSYLPAAAFASSAFFSILAAKKGVSCALWAGADTLGIFQQRYVKRHGFVATYAGVHTE